MPLLAVLKGKENLKAPLLFGGELEGTSGSMIGLLTRHGGRWGSSHLVVNAVVGVGRKKRVTRPGETPRGLWLFVSLEAAHNYGSYAPRALTAKFGIFRISSWNQQETVK